MNAYIPVLVQLILESYALPWFGTHGVMHWARVLENGMNLAKKTGADVEIVRLFAVLHDSKRTNEGIDPGHGLRGAEYAVELRGTYFDLADYKFDLLYQACARHTKGDTEADVTIQTCWDADRLDLLRAGIRPAEEHLCTEFAKDPTVIAWANERSQYNFAPDFVYESWLAGGSLS
jgi:uncharacterized protein